MNPLTTFECKVLGISTLPICSSSVVGPLSELSTRVHVRGIAGATVEVTAPPQRVVAKGTLGSSDDRIDLLPNERLTKAGRPAKIEVSFNNNVQGSRKAEDGRAHFDPQLPLSSQAPAAARQVVPN